MTLLLPAVQQAREAARRMQCKNNLMNICLALNQYEMSHERLPPGAVNATGPIKNEPAGYHVGWIVQILPQLDQRNVYRRIDFSVGIYDPKNTAPTSVKLAILTCPSDPMFTSADTSYAGNHHDSEAPIDVDNNGVLFLNSSIRFDDIEDGSTNTIFVGERIRGSMSGWAAGTRVSLRNGGAPLGSEKPAFNAQPAGPQPIPLAQPAQGDPANQALLKVGGFGSVHLGGAHFGLGDGAVRFISENVDRTVFKNLLNRNDGSLTTEF
jgi:hypothetical protein